MDTLSFSQSGGWRIVIFPEIEPLSLVVTYVGMALTASKALTAYPGVNMQVNKNLKYWSLSCYSFNNVAFYNIPYPGLITPNITD